MLISAQTLFKYELITPKLVCLVGRGEGAELAEDVHVVGLQDEQGKRVN